MRPWITLVLVLLPAVAVAQPSQGVVTMLLGQATLTRRSPATPQPLRFKDDLSVSCPTHPERGALHDHALSVRRFP